MRVADPPHPEGVELLQLDLDLAAAGVERGEDSTAHFATSRLPFDVVREPGQVRRRVVAAGWALGPEERQRHPRPEPGIPTLVVMQGHVGAEVVEMQREPMPEN